MFRHSLSSKMMFSFNSFFHFVSFGKYKRHFILYFLSFHHKKTFLESASEVAFRCFYTV